MKEKEKADLEIMELKKVEYEDKKNELRKNNYQNIIIIILIIFLCLILGVSFIVFETISQDFKLQLQNKDNEIQKIQEQLNKSEPDLKLQLQNKDNELKKIQELLNKLEPDFKLQLKNKDNEIQKMKEQLNKLEQQNAEQSKRLMEKKLEEPKKHLNPIEQQYLYDTNFYSENNMHYSEDLNRLSYNLILHTHTLEKGMSHFELRPFSKDNVKLNMNLLKKAINYDGYKENFGFKHSISGLREYKKIYEEHNWTYYQEYNSVSDFLKNFTNISEIKSGAYILTKEELKKDYNIDYKKFVKSRHSTRNYKHEQLKLEDIKEAVDMARFTASACNRQYIKLHYYPSGEMKKNVIRHSIGKGGLYLEGVNTFIITFDVNGLEFSGERNQGYFNAGLFATNLVNAFHSLGIGTCFIQFANHVDAEKALKKSNGIPSHERIAVILYAGYYDEKSIFAESPRKDIEEYLTVHE